MSADHKIHLGDAFLFGNGFSLVLFLFHGSPRAGFESDIATLTSDKNHLGNAISLGNGIGPVFFISRQSNARILSSADISWFKTFPLAPCSRGTRRVPQARLR